MEATEHVTEEASSQHTPGPWHLFPIGNGFYIKAGNYNVAVMNAGMTNAKLMAAAPRMLAALESIIEWTDMPTGQVSPEQERISLMIRNAARAAIQEATR